MKITNKHILDKLNVIQDKIPDGNNYMSDMSKTVRDISLIQDNIKEDIRQMTIACRNRRFGCVDNK